MSASKYSQRNFVQQKPINSTQSSKPAQSRLLRHSNDEKKPAVTRCFTAYASTMTYATTACFQIFPPPELKIDNILEGCGNRPAKLGYFRQTAIPTKPEKNNRANVKKLQISRHPRSGFAIVFSYLHML